MSGIESTRSFLKSIGLPASDSGSAPDSQLRFPDGGQWRVEIPSVEGPHSLQMVFDSADEFRVPIHRVSQGSGVMLLTDDDLTAMAKLGKSRGIEISLFVGPRAGWDTGAMAYMPAGKIVGPRIRGADQLVHAVEDVRRSCEHGITSVLVTDDGLLYVLLKGSVMLAAANPASVRLLQQNGLTTFNTPTDLSIGQLAALRAATSMPLDIYI